MGEKLPEAIEKQLIELGARGRESIAHGDIDSAERDFLAAWAALPEPKEKWDRTPSIARAMVLFYRTNKKFDRAHEWLTKTKMLYGSSVAAKTEVDFLAATVYYEAGEHDAAYQLFDSLYKQYKQRPFQGEKPDYLKFYKGSSAKK